jgi:hypothetical protein
MQLQPVVMNAFSQDPASASAVASPQIQSSANASDSSGDSAFVRILEEMQEIAKTQDKRIADDLKVQTKSRSSTAKMLGLLQLQHDLDDMQVSATLAKNIASQIGQALTMLTQRT